MTLKTTVSNYQIKEFIDIINYKGNIRFRIILHNGMKVPADKEMTLNINQIDDDAKKRLFDLLEEINDIKT